MRTLALIPSMVVVLVLGFVVGHCEWGGQEQMAPSEEDWSCSMHPQVSLPEPGPCPICGMDLVVRDKDAGYRRLVMSEEARWLAEIQTARVLRQHVVKEVRLSGKVDYDETRVRTISAWVPGRLERLFVDYTGIKVQKGDHMVELYSTELLTAQEELLTWKQGVADLRPGTSATLADSRRRAYASARDKLLLWGLTEEQVAAIEERGTAVDTITINAPISGVVIHKALDQGDYVRTGSRIYKVADLSRLWVLMDAYEQDLPWLHYGQEVAITTEARPGRVLHGLISFIDPVVDERTRTVKLRVNVDNESGLLKPGMFVRAVVSSKVAAGGKVVDERLAGKWISPMHPEIVKDGPGTCDVCGMDLVPAEQLGYVTAAGEAPLVVPMTAPLITGKRAVVYVRDLDAHLPTYEAREVVLGPRARNHYLVEEGLSEGELVVTHGAFKIDSSLQILGKWSMMSITDPDVFRGAAFDRIRGQLGPLFDAYLGLQVALSEDDLAAARAARGTLGEAVAAVGSSDLATRPRAFWLQQQRLIGLASRKQTRDLEKERALFDRISKQVLRVERAFGHGTERLLYEVFCDMAFEKRGASWLQADQVIANPYYGSSMLRCGEVRTGFASNGAVVDLNSGGVQEQQIPQQEATGPLAALYSHYFDGQEALAADDRDQAAAAFTELARETATLGEDPLLAAVQKAAVAATSGDLAALRTAFQPLSIALTALHGARGHRGPSFHEVLCPMAFDDKGAKWLQRTDEIANPYFGSQMLQCGTIQRSLKGEER